MLDSGSVVFWFESSVRWAGKEVWLRSVNTALSHSKVDTISVQS